MKKRCLCTALVVVPLVGLAALVVWWWLRWREQDRGVPETRIPIPLGGPVPEPDDDAFALAQGGDAAEAAPDDLSAIEGIGPRIRQVLADAGIETFADLAAQTAAETRECLLAAGVRLAFPETWAEQAALAAAGDWDGLRALQATLVRGRRI